MSRPLHGPVGLEYGSIRSDIWSLEASRPPLYNTCHIMMYVDHSWTWVAYVRRQWKLPRMNNIGIEERNVTFHEDQMGNVLCLHPNQTTLVTLNDRLSICIHKLMLWTLTQQVRSEIEHAGGWCSYVAENCLFTKGFRQPGQYCKHSMEALLNQIIMLHTPTHILSWYQPAFFQPLRDDKIWFP